MIARRRGDTHTRNRWRPAARAEQRPDSARREHEADDPPIIDQPKRRLYRPRVMVAVIAAIGIAVIAGTLLGSGQRPKARLPATPQQWVDAWTAAALENPARVCQQLFAPALAAAFKADTGRTCTPYYTFVNTTSFRIRHVLQDGPTATVEARQVGAQPKWGYFTIVLSRVREGWQAVDLVPGESVRPR